jgi:hypothetical protein
MNRQSATSHGAEDPRKKVLRLRKKHAPGGHERPTPADGARLLRAQSPAQAVAAGIVAIVVFSALWLMVTTAFGKIYPWMTLLLGIGVGLVVRRAGQGIDWRFPVIAAALAFIGSIVGNVVIAASTTAGEFETSIFRILGAVTTMTWPIFFDEVMTAADFVFALFAAGLAAFYANRRLTRRQYQAIRIWQEEYGGTETANE